MQSESQYSKEEENDCVYLFEAYKVLNCPPYKSERGTTKETCSGNLREKLIVIEIDVSIVLEYDLNEVAKAHAHS